MSSNVFCSYILPHALNLTFHPLVCPVLERRLKKELTRAASKVLPQLSAAFTSSIDVAGKDGKVYIGRMTRPLANNTGHLPNIHAMLGNEQEEADVNTEEVAKLDTPTPTPPPRTSTDKHRSLGRSGFAGSELKDHQRQGVSPKLARELHRQRMNY